MALHVLGHLLELPHLASADWRRHGPREARLAGAGMRASAVAIAIVAGFALGFLALSRRQAVALRTCLSRFTANAYRSFR